ncbi:uncharacterized protein LOC126687449 [Mercurialis annua]|uniref:uncharacterized protein LOC126687449 n=1 Tax=Mercurialis annua TaxID=3986 RepID=UPI00216046A5|nr:uncharacterized protein LOC126687449 [Mercurialis annua]
MRLISWNCQGLGSTLTIQHLKLLCTANSPEILFLMETKNKNKTVLHKTQKLGFHNQFLVEPRGSAGGLAILWTENCRIAVQYHGAYFVICVVTTPHGISFDACFCHFSSVSAIRRNQFRELLLLKPLLSKEFVFCGDFNDILCPSEKEGGLPYLPLHHSNFHDFIFELQGIDLKFVGSPFTWCNRRNFPDTVRERLDRVLVSSEWLNTFPAALVEHLADVGSDHKPLLLHLTVAKAKHHRRFHFDKRWAEKNEITEIILHAWQKDVRGSKMFRIHCKLKGIRQAITRWSRGTTTNSKAKIKHITQRMNAEKTKVMPLINWNLVRSLEKDLARATLEEEVFWAQKARQDWLRSGDQNTKFFHAKTKQRQRRNAITGISDSSDRWRTTPGEISTTICAYFKEIFSSSNPTGIDRVFADFPNKVTTAMNDQLTSQVTAQEVCEAVYSINPSKAPGSDGFTGFFFHHYWRIIGPDISDSIIEFFNGARMLRSLNHTLIALIPKDKAPRKVTDYRPISLCSVYYKIISKVITTRLQKILPQLIDKTQNGFIQGRSISDNILIAHEMMHFLKTKKSGKSKYLAMKLDISKAYDRVEWAYVLGCLRAWGFSATFINWIHQCISTTSFSVLLNGAAQNYFCPTRGLRQGDPLSPLLFVLCAEGLSHLIQRAIASNALRGIQLTRHCPSISHLFFADDSLIFAQITPTTSSVVKHIIQSYGQASGQIINLTKSSVSFSRNTPESLANQIMQELNLSLMLPSDKYLGLPVQVLSSKNVTFAGLLSILQSKLSGWKEKFLSQGGKEVLIKAVLMAIPVYAMMCFLLPKSLNNRINRLISKFWWGEHNEDRKIAWVAWAKMCRSKWQGGLGIRDLDAFNRALLAKQCWRIMQNPDSVLFQLWKGRYFRNGNVLDATRGYNPSWGWQSMLKGRALLQKGLRWQCNSGTRIRILQDAWLPGKGNYLVQLKTAILHSEVPSLVCDLMDSSGSQWNRELVSRLFIEQDAQDILAIPIPYSHVADRLVWDFTRDGSYTVKSGYYQELGQDDNGAHYPGSVPVMKKSEWKILWKIQIPNKIRIFLWKLFHKGIPVAENLNFRVKTTLLCPHGQERETITHMLFHCEFARRVWFLSDLHIHSEHIQHHLFEVIWSNFIASLPSHEDRERFLAIFSFYAWSIWKARNSKIFKDNPWSIEETVSFARQAKHEFDTAINVQPHTGLPNATRSTRSRGSPTTRIGLSRETIIIQYDGGICKELKAGSVAGTAFSGEGAHLGSFARSFRGIWDPGIVEFLALREAVCWAKNNGWSNVIFEGDAIQVSKSINTGLCQLSDAWGLCQDIWLQSNSFDYKAFRWIKRGANKEAHRLVQLEKGELRRLTLMNVIS